MAGHFFLHRGEPARLVLIGELAELHGEGVVIALSKRRGEQKGREREEEQGHDDEKACVPQREAEADGAPEPINLPGEHSRYPVAYGAA